MFTNTQIAQQLRQVAAVFEVKDMDLFRAKAYENAANSLENLTISARDLWEQNKLSEIPGIGPSIAEHLEELFRTGKVKHFQIEMKRVPAGMFPLLDIRGIGPKTAYKLAKKFKLSNEKTSLNQIKKKITTGKLADLLRSTIITDDRMLLSEAIRISTNFLIYINTIPEVSDAQPLGSLRRCVATVGDIDLAVCTNSPKETLSAILKYPEIEKVITSGESLSRVLLKSGREIDIKLAPENEWGSLLQHSTGSKLHNIQLRSWALEKNLSLSEHGITHQKTGEVYRAKTEASFYTHLGLPYIPPELREGEEELELAKKNKIPNLVMLSDIKGDLHLHSDFQYESSHDLGRSPLKIILDEAAKLNYEYLGLTDHNPKFSNLDTSHKKNILKARKNNLVTQYKDHENKVKTRVPKLLIGLEIDIRKTGDLSLENELLEDLDYAIVSVHSNFDLSKDENTSRIIKALSHPKAIILGHPTGRIFNHRESIQADWLRIIDFCQKNKKVLEINAAPDRLDLPDDLIKIAVRSGVKLCINSDSHEVSHLDFIKYGVWTARRGWATKRDIINTYTFKDLQTMLNL